MINFAIVFFEFCVIFLICCCSSNISMAIATDAVRCLREVRYVFFFAMQCLAPSGMSWHCSCAAYRLVTFGAMLRGSWPRLVSWYLCHVF